MTRDRASVCASETHDNWIMNLKTGKKISLVKENGTFAMDVEFMVADLDKNAGPGFTRQW